MLIRWTTIFLDFPEADFAAGVAFWQHVTGTSLSAKRGSSQEFATLIPQLGDAYLRVQQLQSGSPSSHLDLHVDESEMVDAVALAIESGATAVHHEPGLDVLRSPGGYLFCIVPWEGENQVPAPQELLGSEGIARLDQLCLDVPPSLWTTETTFWSALTGWEFKPLGDSEFARLLQPNGLPVKILLQRLDDDVPHVASHPDFAAPQRDSLAPAHAALGATVGPANEEWTVMNDPTGGVYCLTYRQP